jgi:hypothetical protein
MGQPMLFDIGQEVMCPGVKLPDGTRLPEHPTFADNFHKNQYYCKTCQKTRNAILNNTEGYKKAKYHPDTGEKWCYKLGEFGNHYTDPDNFGESKQWDDGKWAHCNACVELDEEWKHFPKRAEWSAAVLKRAGYACELCGGTQDLHAHHKDSWNWCEERRFDVENGVCLCSGDGGCHNDFHDEYGWGNNTEAQWEEYVISIWT